MNGANEPIRHYAAAQSTVRQTPMTILFMAAPLVAFLVLAAHFFRADNQLGLWVSLLAIVLMFVRRPWAARALQVLLVLGSLEWLRSTVTLIQARSELGQPFLRLALILGAVILLTCCRRSSFRRRDSRPTSSSVPRRSRTRATAIQVSGGASRPMPPRHPTGALDLLHRFHGEL